MLKKSITYEDFNGEEVTEDFFFHLSKSELVKLELTHEGGLEVWLERIMRAKDGQTIMDEFEKIILLTCGKRSEDGRRFIKNDQIREDFHSSGAYDVLFMEIVTNADAAAEFIAGTIPKDLREEAEKVVASNDLAAVPEPATYPKRLEIDENDQTNVRVITRAEFVAMSQEQLVEMGPKLASGEYVLKD